MVVIGRGSKEKLVPLFAKHLKNKNLIGFDIETSGKENKFYMAGLYFPDGTYKSFYNKRDLIREFKKKKYYTNTYVVATNLAFDLTGLFYDEPEWNSLDIIMSGGRMISATLLASNRQKLTFIDSYNHAPFSVKIMGDILKLPKLKTPISMINDNKGYARIPKNIHEQLELEIYNKRDCEVTQKFMKLLTDGYYEAGGKLKLTIASTSLDIFRRKYLRRPIYKEREILGFDMNYLVYESYYGGRTENFMRGKIISDSFNFESKTFSEKGKHYRMYDINSLYPSVMVREYPNPNFARYVYLGTEEVIHKYEGVSRVKLFCPDMRYPLLPMKINDKLVFPTGYIQGVYTNVEIRKAISIGYELLEVGEQLYYKKTFYPFKEFVYDMYNKRKELKAKNHPNEFVYKIVLNSLYGKFASKHLTETIFFNKEFLSDEGIDAVRNNENVIMKDDNNGMIINKKICDEAYVIPILSSYTTAFARLKLYDYIVKYDALYCDTDSIITDKVLPESLELGGMKVEYDIIEGVLVKPKMYYLKILKKGEIEDMIKLKGVPKKILYKNEQIQLNKEVFDHILEGEKVVYNKFTKLKEGVRRGLIPNAIIDVEKFIKLSDDKRIWDSEFNHEELINSKPFYLQKEEINNEGEVKKCITSV